MNRIITDSTIWKEYLEKGSTKEAKVLEKLIKNDKVVICGYTLAKVLKDIKDKETFEKLLKGFLALLYVEIEEEDWIRASRLIFEFKRLSIELGLLCVLRQRKNLKVLTRNKGIKKIKGVKLYEDEKQQEKRSCQVCGLYKSINGESG